MTDAPTQGSQDIDLFGLLSVMFDNKLIISIFTILGFGLATALAFWMTPVYRGEVALLPADQDAESDSLSALGGQFGGLASLAGIDLTGDHAKQEAMATLKSRSFTLDFIRDMNLMPILFEDKWDPNAEKWASSDVSEHPSEWDAYKEFDETVRFIEEEPGSGVIVLAIEWRDRELAATWANELANRVNKKLRDKAILEAQTSIDYLRKELEKTSVVELQHGIYRLIENHINKIMLANVRDEYAFEIIDVAMVPDEDDFSSPKRFLIMAMGLLLGGFFGLAFAVVRAQRQIR